MTDNSYVRKEVVHIVCSALQSNILNVQSYTAVQQILPTILLARKIMFERKLNPQDV